MDDRLQTAANPLWSSAMSRRSKARAGKVAGSQVPKWCGLGIAALLVLSGGGYLSLRGYLQSDGFRQFLSERVSKVVGMSGEFSPFEWQGLALRVNSYEATGEGAIRELKAERLATEVRLTGVKRGVWELKGTSIGSLQMTLQPDIAEIEREHRPDISPPSERKSAWGLPRKVELDEFQIESLNLDAQLSQGPLSARNLRVTAQSDGGVGAYKAKISEGHIETPWKQLPSFEIEEINMRVANRNDFYLTDAKLNLTDRGRITANGKWQRDSGNFSVDGICSGIACQEVVNATWAKRISGEITLPFQLKRELGELQAQGGLKIENAMLTALPVLEVLAAYADTTRFRTIALEQATANWSRRGETIEISEIIMASESLARLEGTLRIDGQKLDGHMHLGIVPGLLARLPGAETHVFVARENGLLWAPVRISGTLNDPKEDLTHRLIAAAGLRVIEALPEHGKALADLALTKLGEDPAEIIEKGEKILDQGTEIIHQADQLLDSFLNPPPPEEEP